MVEFKDLSENDKKIICKLIRHRIKGVWTGTEDFYRLSEEGLEYYKNELIKTLPSNFKK